MLRARDILMLVAGATLAAAVSVSADRYDTDGGKDQMRYDAMLGIFEPDLSKDKLDNYKRYNKEDPC